MIFVYFKDIRVISFFISTKHNGSKFWKETTQLSFELISRRNFLTSIQTLSRDFYQSNEIFCLAGYVQKFLEINFSSECKQFSSFHLHTDLKMLQHISNHSIIHMSCQNLKKYRLKTWSLIKVVYMLNCFFFFLYIWYIRCVFSLPQGI